MPGGASKGRLGVRREVMYYVFRRPQRHAHLVTDLVV